MDIEHPIDRGEKPSALRRSEIKLVTDLVDLHIADMQEVGRPPLRSKADVLEALKRLAAAVHGIEVSAENVRLARVALTRLSLMGRAIERDRRPLETEFERLIGYFEGNQRQLIAVRCIIRFAVATAIRRAEFYSL